MYYTRSAEQRFADWSIVRTYIGRTVLLTENRWSRIKGDRLATLLDVRVDTHDTHEYDHRVGRFTHDPLQLRLDGAALCATIRWHDRDYTNYRINPYALRDPDTRELIL